MVRGSRKPPLIEFFFLGGLWVQNMLNGARSQAVDGTMGVHMPCPYTLARPAVGARWVGGRWRWWGSSVVPPGMATATSQSPDGSTPSTLCRGSGGAAVFLVLSGRKASVYPKDKKFSWMAKHEDRLYSQFSAQNTDGQTM